tara:strand:- start:37735 stop:38463 length:729 start_codon:yes stop_codon:yes gene_type:complete
MNILLFGNGKWGKILKNNLLNSYKVIKVFDSKSDIDDFDYSNIDWAVIATNNLSHFKISNFLIKKKINIFCEKPLTLSYIQSKKLINLANKNGCKLFVNHIYNFKKLDFKFSLKNTIKRSKISFKSTENIIYDLFYHDLYLILPSLDDNNYQFMNIKESFGKLNFQIKSKNKYYNFEYDTKKKSRHIINKVNLIDKINYIPIVFDKVFKNDIDLKGNNIQALKCNKIIENFFGVLQNHNRYL